MTSIRTRMILLIVVPTLALYVVILGGTLVYLRSLALRSMEQTMTRLASNYAGRFDGFLRESAAAAEVAAVAFGLHRSIDEKGVFIQLRAQLSNRPFIYGACAAFEPGLMRPIDELYAPYVHRAGDSIHEMNITRDVYDWYADPQWTWYQQPKQLDRAVWSDPYFDEGAGNVLMTTYSAPFRRESEFAGVTTVDIDLSRLRETIGGQITDGAEFVVLDHRGGFIYAPQPEWILHRTIADVARESSNRELGALVPRLLGGKSGVATVTGWTDRERQLLFYAPIPSTGWSFVAYLPERVVLAGLHRQMLIGGAALAATLVLIVLSVIYVSGRITRPLAHLTAGVGRIAAGDLDARVTGVTNRDEIGLLASAFNAMAGKLRQHVDKLAAEEASRRKLERDLEIAREIQRGLLPARHPDLPGYDIAGWTRSADQTGGDYYDWQTLPDGTIAVSLADVTGHGIGPALVTAACRAYARASFAQAGDLGGALTNINTLIHEDLQDGRFVTYAASLINPHTHSVQMLSAGHGPLLYYRARDRRVEQFDAHHIPLGIMSEVAHGPPSVFHFAPGDFLMFITDGFFEWANPAGEPYGLDRLCRIIRDACDLSSREIIERVLEDVLRFAEGTQQLDDLTAVVLKRHT